MISLTWVILVLIGGVSLSFLLFAYLLTIPSLKRFFSLKIRPRDIHEGDTPRIGGIVIIPLFLLGVWIITLSGVLSVTHALGFSLGSVAVLLYGLIDEKYDLAWYTQLCIQVGIALIIILFDIGLDQLMMPWGEYLSLDHFELVLLGEKWIIFRDLVTLVWIVGLMNVVNWLDGVDGLAGGTGVIAFGILYALSLMPEVGQDHIALLSILLASLYAGFLIHNWYPSKVFLGTSGSMFLGFSLAVLSIMSGGKIATSALVFAFPIIDACIVIWQRLRARQSIFQGDNRHFHYMLLNSGFSPIQTTSMLLSVSFFFGIMALFLDTQGKIITFIGGSIVLIFIRPQSRKKY